VTQISTAIVIGGGIAGPVTAMALRKAGIAATVYEAYPSTADGVGGTLALAPNGLAALKIIGVDQSVVAIGQPISTMVMEIGRKRLEMPSLHGVPPMQMVHRADLYRVLHDAAAAQGITTEYGKRLTSARETTSGIVATFADGSTATAEVLIGADGVRSTVRTLIDPDAPGPRYTGSLGFEATADVDVPVEPGTITFAFGKRGYYLYWSRPGGGTGWGVNLPQDRPSTMAEARAVPKAEWMRTLRQAYGDDVPGGELLRRSNPEELQIIGSLHIMPPLRHWHRGRMALVGDAAHAPSNSSGQGASLAIESAIEVARCLRDLPDVPAAFAAYESLRRGRVEGIARRAARANRAKAPGAIGRAIMPILMRAVMRLAMNPEKSLGPVQRHVIDWDARVAS
jgi:2-polyprenyl-6-methoxyphenol hydroxylase-like FAD-dependent oxidoreductase